MNRVEIKMFKAAHLDLIELREHDLKNLPLGMFEAFEDMPSDKGQALTLIVDGRILCIVGFYMLWDGVMDVYVLPSIYIPKYPVIFVKTIRRYVKSLGSTFNVHRMQSTALADEASDKWMKAVGFEEEGVLRQYSKDKSDYKMWARILECQD